MRPITTNIRHALIGTSPGQLTRLAALVALATGAIILTVDGCIDKWASGLFYDPSHGFSAQRAPLVVGLRVMIRLSAFGVGLFLLFALTWRTILGRALLGLSRASIVYLLAVFLLGPGLLVNGILKAEWGRARPAQITEFGGDKRFTPPLVIADQCARNCSFVSGEASLGFAFAAFGFIALTRRRMGQTLGIGLGCAFGLLRIAQGGHFLSDVYFAGIFTVALAWILHRLLIERRWLDRLGLWPQDDIPARSV